MPMGACLNCLWLHNITMQTPGRMSLRTTSKTNTTTLPPPPPTHRPLCEHQEFNARIRAVTCPSRPLTGQPNRNRSIATIAQTDTAYSYGQAAGQRTSFVSASYENIKPCTYCSVHVVSLCVWATHTHCVLSTQLRERNQLIAHVISCEFVSCPLRKTLKSVCRQKWRRYRNRWLRMSRLCLFVCVSQFMFSPKSVCWTSKTCNVLFKPTRCTFMPTVSLCYAIWTDNQKRSAHLLIKSSATTPFY